MRTTLHKANTRGQANHGWLKARHTFSFANYYDPKRMNFGVLQVLNDDTIAGGKGFGTHPHDNMEIVTIPLSGALKHKDSMGNSSVVSQGDVQVMSAGKGIFHSEFNHHKKEKVKLLQIWMLPNQKNVKPRYDQITLDTEKMENNFAQILSPNKDDEGVWVYQNAWWHMGSLDKGIELNYDLKDLDNGVYVFVIDGNISIGRQKLNKRDGFGIKKADSFVVKADSKAQVLLMEVPMST